MVAEDRRQVAHFHKILTLSFTWGLLVQTTSFTGARPVTIDKNFKLEGIMKKFLKLLKTPKFWIILLIIIACTILFGSFASQIGSYIAQFFSTLWNWIGTGLRWLADVLNFFGWNGMLT